LSKFKKATKKKDTKKGEYVAQKYFRNQMASKYRGTVKYKIPT